MAYPEFDCVWLASDAELSIAAFVTAGAGPMPSNLLEISGLIRSLERRLMSLAVSSEIELLIRYKRPDDFIDIAKRGVFAYDWTDVHRPANRRLKAYELVASPESPIKIDQLPDDLADVARRNVFEGIRFRCATSIGVGLLSDSAWPTSS